MKQLGHRLAPPRFLAFLAVFAAGLGAGIPTLGWARGTMAAFDAAAVVFILLVTGLFRQGEAREMREASAKNDANRVLLLGFVALNSLVVLVTVGATVRHASDPVAVGLVIATLFLAWAFSNLIYALHYAHLYYLQEDGKDAGGLEFRGDEDPDYWDFLYFSATLGMAFATSDTMICNGRIRRVALGQSVAAFVFNLGVIAFAVGTLGGGS